MALNVNPLFICVSIFYVCLVLFSTALWFWGKERLEKKSEIEIEMGMKGKLGEISTQQSGYGPHIVLEPWRIHISSNSTHEAHLIGHIMAKSLSIIKIHSNPTNVAYILNKIVNSSKILILVLENVCCSLNCFS